jgi:hypothetical protein
LNRDFQPTKPNEVYAGDMTYVWTTEGWLYLAVVIDLFPRSVVGWAMDKRMTRQLLSTPWQWRCKDASRLQESFFIQTEARNMPVTTSRLCWRNMGCAAA